MLYQLPGFLFLDTNMSCQNYSCLSINVEEETNLKHPILLQVSMEPSHG
jgi:hypothetical protein